MNFLSKLNLKTKKIIDINKKKANKFGFSHFDSSKEKQIKKISNIFFFEMNIPHIKVFKI